MISYPAVIKPWDALPQDALVVKSLKWLKKTLGQFIEERVLGSSGARWPIYSSASGNPYVAYCQDLRNNNREMITRSLPFFLIAPLESYTELWRFLT